MTHWFSVSRMTIAVVIAVAGIAHAEDVQPLRGGYCFTNHLKIDSPEVVWSCEHIGKVALRQIYEKGFRVVFAYQANLAEKTLPYQYLIIEEQRK